MSSVVIAGDTSGSITVSAPAVAGSNTLTLPAATGTVIYADGSGNLQANSGYGSVATGYLCRAWVNFNGTGTVAIRASGNVSSITDNGVGTYTVNFTTAMPNVNYCITGAADRISDSRGAEFSVNRTTVTVNGFNALVNGSYASGVDYRDSDSVYVAVFR